MCARRDVLPNIFSSPKTKNSIVNEKLTFWSYNFSMDSEIIVLSNETLY